MSPRTILSKGLMLLLALGSFFGSLLHAQTKPVPQNFAKMMGATVTDHEYTL